MEWVTAIFVYFSAEKTGALIKFFFASAALIGALYFYRRHEIAKGFCYVAIFVFISQVIVGGTIYFRTDAQVAALQGLIASDSAAFLAQEKLRMAEVVADFSTYRALQISIVLLGAVLVAISRRRHMPRIQGAGAAFMLLGAMLFLMDLLAAQRAAIYLNALSQ